MEALLLLGVLCLLAGSAGGLRSWASSYASCRRTMCSFDQRFSRPSESTETSASPAPRHPSTPFPRRMPRQEDQHKSLFQPVPRPYTLDQRRPLSQIKVGESLQGRIISFTNFGMYVDVGTVVDGLVHVQDASNTYFVQDLRQRFRSGQSITAWVKFADPVAKKLGLQLFPTMERLERIYRWEDLQVGQPVEGRVVKFSQAGATVDIGGPCMAYLSRKAMKSNHRQRNLLPWDLLALNQTTRCFIFDVDKNRRILDVSTYDPADWPRAFLQRRPASSSLQPPASAFSPEPHAMPAASASESAFLRTSRGISQQDVDIDADLPMGEEDGEEEELELHLGEPSARHALVMDDLASPGHQPAPSRSMEYVHPSRRTTAREVFHTISEGRAEISLRELKQWGYVRRLMDADLLTLATLRQLYQQAGGGRRRMNVREFALFLSQLDEELDLSSAPDAQEKTEE